MKTPAYESSGGALAALLATRQFNWAGLYKITLVNGGTYYYTTSDVPITFNGNTYITAAKSGVVFNRKTGSKIKWRIGVEVDTLQFDLVPNGGTINGQDYLTAIDQGVFDGADVTFYHAYWPQGSWVPLVSPTGILTMFAGRVAPVSAGSTSATFTINSYLDLLNQNLPRNIYQAGCINTLGDTGCTINLAALAVAGTVLTGTGAASINATLANATGYFNLGKVTFTSGANNGISRGVKQYTNGSPSVIALMSPFPNIPAIGDTFNVFPGCDKLQTTCVNKFSNLPNFRGFPYIPENATGV